MIEVKSPHIGTYTRVGGRGRGALDNEPCRLTHRNDH